MSSDFADQDIGGGGFTDDGEPSEGGASLSDFAPEADPMAAPEAADR